MPDAAIHSTDLIIGRGLLTAETVADELRRRLIGELARSLWSAPPHGRQWGSCWTQCLLRRTTVAKIQSMGEPPSGRSPRRRFWA